MNGETSLPIFNPTAGVIMLGEFDVMAGQTLVAMSNDDTDALVYDIDLFPQLAGLTSIITNSDANTGATSDSTSDSKKGIPDEVTTMAEFLSDVYSPSSLLLVQLIRQVNSSVVTLTEDDWKIFHNTNSLLQGFDGMYTSEAAAPVLLEAFRVKLLTNLLARLGSLNGFVTGKNLVPHSRYSSRFT